MKNFKNMFVILTTVLAASCVSTNKISDTKKYHYSVQAGFNHGGITENTDMTVVPNAIAPAEATVDAFSGATQIRYNAGIHINRHLKRNQVEAGIDYMYNYQSFNYTDAGNFYFGVRRIQLSQIMLPLSYNFVLFRSLAPGADIQLKVGAIGQFNFISANDVGISLPGWSVNPWSAGLTCGISAYPIQFNNGSKLGFYFDMYRGSQNYEDYYNQDTFEMPGSSFLKGGLSFKFK